MVFLNHKSSFWNITGVFIAVFPKISQKFLEIIFFRIFFTIYLEVCPGNISKARTD